MSQEHPTSDQGKTERSDNIENYEQYMLYNKAGIAQKLRQLERSNNLITVHFGEGKYSFLTVIVDVIPDKDILVLDYGSDEKLNQKLLQAKRAVLKTQHLGITAQFTCTAFQKAKRHGKVSIACNMPDALLWVQRREFYRVKVPMSDSVVCEIRKEEETIVFPVVDISIGGIALLHTNQDLTFESGELYNSCVLKIADQGSGVVNLEVRNLLTLNENMPENGKRVGMTFLDLTMDMNIMIQRYIHTIETLQQRIKDK